MITGKADSLHAQARLIGYQKALRDEGLLYDPELIYYGDWEENPDIPEQKCF